MSIRKEQVLFLLALALAAWIYSGIETDTTPPRRRKPKEKAYAPAVARAPITAATWESKNLREIFEEPTESRPLLPRPLPFPPLPAVAADPLPLELDPPPMTLIGSETFQAGGSYDEILMKDRLSFPGFILVKEELKWQLARGKAAFPAEFQFQWINKDTKKTEREFSFEGKDVASIVLAGTLRNKLGMESLDVTPSTTNTEPQRAFIMRLLRFARLQPWVYEWALTRADQLLKFIGSVEEGYLYKARVLRAMGDLTAEYLMFKNIEKKLQGTSFQLRGLGKVEARLGLDKYAEEHLREAVRIDDPIDPRNHAALADFLLDRGRAAEALKPARQAVTFQKRTNPSVTEKIMFHAVLVRAHLALGDVHSADKARAQGLAGPDNQFLEDLQEAHVLYAKKDYAGAAGLFEKCNQTGVLPDALFGLAASQLASGKVDAAKKGFQLVIDENPRLRHMGLAGLGLALSAENDKGSDALEKIDAALLAYPTSAYILYLQGRQRRLNGDLVGAIEPLREALKRRDDFLAALAELTVTDNALYEQNRDVSKLIAAARYVDRLVELDAQRAAALQKSNGHDKHRFLPYIEMQGVIHYEVPSLRPARKAFAAGAEEGSLFCQIGLAILDYAEKRTDRALTRLEKLRRPLPPTDANRKFIERLKALILAHGNKEQVLDKFGRRDLGKNWTRLRGSLKPRLRDGELQIRGKLGQSAAGAVRPMQGPGRFLELAVDMLVAAQSVSEFAGIVIEIPGKSGDLARFRAKLGMDEDGEVIFELQDRRTQREPDRTRITVTPGEWHTLVLSVDDPDNVDDKNKTRILKVFFDGVRIVEPIKLSGLRPGSGRRGAFHTELRVEGTQGQPVDVRFKNYRRVQEKQ